ncbi:3-phosphoshikimate 1-carboxyvinyltransferase [Candidatus Kaiserbacteria bacterium RIFCSPHIGHO2_01_FULL_55_17]|uniref:Multifunctional fusion protein n=1 Tax=Candidatus Kaiserbacteria bacterium RIFCSPHIGHO2_01_FULL_55_17 TaxID=1798484 RepID=A0A1F6D8D9_9BACT|nr:MAG: 3-phosphoshikimate 1-carboxyvinyltransferase [Candidatus Kaiserbacteria bacterium RIFCSPHIGHO2_01_FULL_55_17]
MKRARITPLKKPVVALVAIPGSKSYTNRALLLAALAGGTVRIKNPLISDDTHAMIACLRELGLHCTFVGDVLEVSGNLDKLEDRTYTLNANLSGTTIRFILALAATVPGVKVVQGRGRLNERPIAHLVESLRQLGAKIEYVGEKGYPPVRVESSKLKSGTVTMRGTVSSQFLSALLMVAPRVGELSIRVEGEQVSKPYIDMTLEAMKEFGVAVSNENYERYHVPARQMYRGEEYLVEGDISSASYFFAIAALTGSTLTLKNMNPRSLQADIRFLKILEDMGNVVSSKNGEITIEGKGVKPVSVDMQDCPDQAQTLAVLAAFAEGTTTISGISTLRIKETERVVAIEKELAKMGIRTESSPDTITIYGGNPAPARVDTYDDHRMAMAFAVAGTKLAGMEINDPDVVSKTFPNFWDALHSIGVGVEVLYENPNIVLIGMRGGGKSSVAKLLSEKLGRKFLDLDAMVESQEGMGIPEVVEKYGWGYFRDRESEIVKKAAKQKNAIISTGGGAIGRPENIAALKQRGIVVFLSAPADTLARRIDSETGKRPRLTQAGSTLEEVEAVLAEREKFYETVADIVIDDTGMGLEEKLGEVLKRLEKHRVI